MDGVHPVGVHVVREPRRAADPGQEHRALPAHPELGHEHLHGGEDRVVTAPRAPADLLVGGPVLAGGEGTGTEVVFGVGQVGHQSDTFPLAVAPLAGAVPWPLDRDPGDGLGVGSRRSTVGAVDLLEDGRLHRRGPEGDALDLGEGDGVDQVLGPQQAAELAQVDLGHQHLLVAAEDLAEVGGERD